MEVSHEIVLGCYAADPDTAAIKFDWFCEEYVADQKLEYSFVESIRRLPRLFGEYIDRQKSEETQKVLDDISDEIYDAATSGDPVSSDELSKVYLMLNTNQFDHRTAIFYNIDDDPMALPIPASISPFFFIRVVIFQ